MQRRLARSGSRTSSRPARPTSPTRPTGSTARGPASSAAESDDEPRRGKTGVDGREARARSAAAHRRCPTGFNVHKTIQRFLDNRRKTIETGEGIDWAMAEHWPSARCSTKASRSACRARIASAAPSRSATRCSIDQETEQRYTPLKHVCRRPGALRGHQLDAVGGGGARLRVRLLARRAERADAVGGAVRRLRQRRAGRLRPVHLVGRAQVAAHVGPRLPAAARLRGPGSGAFLGAPRALPAAVRRRQHAGRQLHDAGELLPHPAPPAAARVPQAADPDDAEVAAAPQARGVDARRAGAGHDLPSPAVGRRAERSKAENDQARPGRRDPPRRAVLGQGLLRPLRGAREARASTTSICCASSSSIRSRRRR